MSMCGREFHEFEIEIICEGCDRTVFIETTGPRPCKANDSTQRSHMEVKRVACKECKTAYVSMYFFCNSGVSDHDSGYITTAKGDHRLIHIYVKNIDKD